MYKYWESISGDMFDFRSFYDRIAAMMPNGSRICEVGIANGKSAIYLAEALANQGKSFTMSIVDNLDYGHTDQLIEILTNIQKSGLADRFDTRGLGKSSLDASCKFPDEYFNFVFLDSSHEYSMTKSEIRLWWRKILPNFYLSGHDATGEENPGVAQAIKEVIPEKFLSIEQTEKGYGVWIVKNSNGAYVN